MKRQSVLTAIVALTVVAIIGGCATTPRESHSGIPLHQTYEVVMSDGVTLQVDVHLPENVEIGQKLTSVVTLTKYWRAIRTRLIEAHEHPFTEAGYAEVLVDIRGSGASEGTWGLYDERERADYGEILDWIVQQPWSDGKTVLYGLSYLGGAAMHAVASGHQSITGSIPLFASADLYEDVFFPGGAANVAFTELWSRVVEYADSSDHRFISLEVPGYRFLIWLAVAGVEPGASDPDGTRLRELIEMRKERNLRVAEEFAKIDFRDDQYTWSGGSASLAAGSTLEYADEISRSGVPIFAMEGWYDGANALGALRLYGEVTNPMELWIGPWGHGVIYDLSPFPLESPVLSEQEATELSLGFLESLEHNRPRRVIRYFTMGQNEWQESESWPPRDSELVPFALDTESRLRPLAGADITDGDGAAPADQSITYTVDWDAYSEEDNRYLLTYSQKPFSNRAKREERILAFESDVFDDPLVLTGTPLVELDLSIDRTDGNVLAYLETVLPDGRVLYLTEGNLRLLHRAQAAEELDAAGAVARSFLRRDAAPMVPGESEIIRFHLQPISVELPPGSRLRASLAGHDAATFERIPETGDLTWTLSLGGASRVLVPIVSR